MQLSLELPGNIETSIQKRLNYVFKIFCTLKNYAYAENSDYSISYCNNNNSNQLKFNLSYIDLKKSSDLNLRWELIQDDIIKRKYGIHRIPVFFGSNNYQTDILSEIFLWISLQFEYIQKDNTFDNIYPFKNSLHGFFNLDPKIPYASIWMDILNKKISDHYKKVNQENSSKILIVNSHDIDFLPKSNLNSLFRLFKNYIISIIKLKDKNYSKQLKKIFFKNFPSYSKLFDNIEILLKLEKENNIKGIYNFLIEDSHIKDGNYTYKDEIFKTSVNKCIENGFEVGLHGSYSTSDIKGKLSDELEILKSEGIEINGVRQHWLRFNYNHYFQEVDQNKIKYDMTIGFNETNGFRSGMAAAYPLYDFENETNFKFLEYPLVLMENTLFYEDKEKFNWYEKTDIILENVYNFNSGGVSILWHDSAFQGTNFPLEFIELYKKIIQDKRFEFTDGKTVYNHFKPLYENNKIELN
ncbi:MAG: hypothetical protein IAE65_13375 [Ignavibacteria bacterium]|nr:hypothetical protein [Ignavibacteria bacterium]